MTNRITKKDIKLDKVYTVEAHINDEIRDYGNMIGADVLAVIGTAKFDEEMNKEFGVNMFCTAKANKVYFIEEA